MTGRRLVHLGVVHACVVHRGMVTAGHLVLGLRGLRGLGAAGMGRRQAHARHRKGGDRESHNGDGNGAKSTHSKAKYVGPSLKVK